ncbi:DUF2142 domain-containing protein [Acidisphaera sp. S103]|uniref:DUF2142 domain-containing protein n=1 Tax=Acidisphaera sp. S103 TaxID=1747223 RepID=UPI00131E1803|nr:DUF2142 domain-containing protein [Acidisphaera sp. S103]
MLGLIGVLPLVFLTPPFQVPDEQQHFYRAYQLSELDLRGVVRDGAAGAVLPSSLPELADRFLGTRAIHTDRPVRPTPLRETLKMLAKPLDPTRREFVDFSGAAFYSPLPYLPQAVAIAVGRGLGLGPLGLLYAARLVNGLAALLVAAAALRALPVGNMLLLVFGLLPMAVYEFASASPDAAMISAAFLFTATAMRARFRGRWTWKQVLLACVAGCVFCPLKPVYAPLLVMGLPGVFRRRAAGHVIAVHAVLIATVLGATGLWLAYISSTLVLPVPGASLSQQFAGIVAHPNVFAGTVLNTIEVNGLFYMYGTIGILGWLRIPLPETMYLLPMIAVLMCVMLRHPITPRIGPAEALWQTLLLGTSALLVLIALYLYWTPVGEHVISGVQGRYFLPLAGLAAVTLGAAVPPRPRTLGPLLELVVVLTVATEVVWTSIVVVQAYKVF